MLAVLLLAQVVLMPEKPGLTWWEIQRLMPGVALEVYDERAKTVHRAEGDVIVIYAEVSKHRGRLAVSSWERGLVVVFVKEVEQLLGTDIGNLRARIALGHIIAHELEHIRRRSAEHDAEGFFRPSFSREYLLSLGSDR